MSNQTKHKLRILFFTLFIISIISISGIVVYAMQPISIPLEVKEPLTILDYPTGFSLYAGETTNFEFIIDNHASVTIFQEFDFQLNDTDYQNIYVTFSNHNYSIPSGINRLQAWLTISPNAPQANFFITINKKTDTTTPTPAPTPTTASTLTPTLELLAAGTKWAAQKGNNALYISWKANYENHHTTDGTNWSYHSETDMNRWQKSVLAALEQANFDVTQTGDLPEDLAKYDIVVICGYYALEPKHEPQIRDYILNGGNIVLTAATPAYLVSYSKSLDCTNDLEVIEDWFGAGKYANGGGPIKVVSDNPVGTSFVENEFIYLLEGSVSCSAVGSLSRDSEVVAVFESGGVVGFTHEFGAGRIYYQSFIQRLF